MTSPFPFCLSGRQVVRRIPSSILTGPRNFFSLFVIGRSVVLMNGDGNRMGVFCAELSRSRCCRRPFCGVHPGSGADWRQSSPNPAAKLPQPTASVSGFRPDGARRKDRSLDLTDAFGKAFVRDLQN